VQTFSCSLCFPNERRRNQATSRKQVADSDRRHADGLAWAAGNEVTPLIHGSSYFPELRRCVDQEDDLDLLVQQAAAELRRLGAFALDSCLVAYATMPRDAFGARLAGVMSWWGLHDERMYVALLDTLQRTPELGANDLVEYGEARALAVLAQTFDALPIRDGDNPLANHVFMELRCAIEDVGGHWTAVHQHKFAQADAPRRRCVAQIPWASRHQPRLPGARLQSYAPLPHDNTRAPGGSARSVGTRPVGVGVARGISSVISSWSRARGTAQLIQGC
jgi:hypothetical protein